MMIRAPRIALWAAVWAFLSTAAIAGDQPAATPRTVRLRIDWGALEARAWTGVLEIDRGQVADPKSLGVEADEAATIWTDGSAIWIQRTAARVYDGLDFAATCDSDAVVTFTLQSSDGSARLRVRGRVGDFDEPGHAIRESSGNLRAAIRRTPGDALVPRLARDHLIFEPGETFDFHVGLNVDGARVGGAKPLRWTLHPARGTRTLASGGAPFEISGERSSPLAALSIELPETEGVYDLKLSALDGSRDVQQSSIQLVVLSASGEPSSAELSPKEDGGVAEPTVVDSFDLPADAEQRRLSHGNETNLAGDLLRRLSEMAARIDRQSQAESAVKWEAYPLRIHHPGRPHRVIIEASGERGETLGLSVLHSNATGQLAQLGLDTGLTFGDDSGAQSARHEVLIWPGSKQLILLAHDLGLGGSARIDSVRVEELPRLDARTLPSSRPDVESDRFIGPYLNKPLLPECFGASEALDPSEARSVDDWVTFAESADRLVEYLGRTGHNSCLLAVAADGSAIYPSGCLEPSPRYDTGVFFSNGQDPLRKDVVELLYRKFDRSESALVPELQFSSPLPELERPRLSGSKTGRDVDLVGRDGRTWRESKGAVRGLAPYYNPLHPEAQRAIRNVVVEFVERYRSHPAFCGVALELSNAGYLQLPGLEWGYDDATVAEFARETGTPIPVADGPERFELRYEALTNGARGKWLAWRAARLAKFHQELAAIVAEAKPGARLILSVAHDSARSASLANETGLLAANPYLEFGLDFSHHAGASNLIVLSRSRVETTDPSRLGASRDSALANLRAPFAGAAAATGELFFHPPQECRIAGFDRLSPWQPGQAWLAVHASPAGPANRRRYARALADGDPGLLFDGGWMAAMGQEHATRSIRDVVRELPVGKLHRVEPCAQPVVVRTAQRDGRTLVCVVNDSAGATTAELELSTTGTAFRRLGSQRIMAPMESSAGVRRVSLTLEPYDVQGFEADDPNLRITRIEVRPSRALVADLQERMKSLHQHIAGLYRGAGDATSPIQVVRFEEPDEASIELAGWDVKSSSGGSLELDSDNPHSGKMSLRMTAIDAQAAEFTADVAAEQSRAVTLTLWMRGDRASSDVRLTFEANVAGKPHAQSATFQTTPEWQRFVFRVQDIPAGRLAQSRIRVESRAGQLWIDDVDIQWERSEEAELKRLTRLYSAATVAWNEGRIGDCERLLERDWPAPRRLPPPAPMRTADESQKNGAAVR